MKSSSRTPIIVIAVLLVCCCLTALTALGLAAWMFLDQPIDVGFVPESPVPSFPPLPTVTRALARSSTATPAPTNTLVISPVRTPTRTNAYGMVVPTPTAAALNRPVTYDTRFSAMTYDVTGKTLNEISKSLHANAMPDAHEPNSRYFAQTEWFLTTDWAWKPTARGCEIDNAKVSVIVTVTLPALVTADAAADAQKRWNTFINNTIEHENGHVKIAYDGARNYQRDLSKFPPAPNCDDIQSRLNDLFRKHFNLIDRTNVEYDAKTRHGETQGAVFP